MVFEMDCQKQWKTAVFTTTFILNKTRINDNSKPFSRILNCQAVATKSVQ